MNAPFSSGRRFFRTLFFFCLTLILSDLGVRLWLAPHLDLNFKQNYRLPADQELAWLPFYLNQLAQSQQNDLVFIGSSPTYGIRIKDPNQTFPVASLKALQAHNPAFKNWQVYNLSAKGFLVADQYYLLQKSLPSAEAVVIQLNYHTFSPRLLKETRIRHPELPEKLGLDVSESEAALLGLRPSPPIAFNRFFRQGLNQIWSFYRLREILAASWLGNTPEGWAYQQYEKRLGTQATDTDERLPFLDLPPAQQMMALKRFGQNIGFQLSEDNSELQSLRLLLKSLKKAGKPALFVMGPLNVEALDAYEALDWKSYDRSLATLRHEIEQAGYPLLDINRTAPLPADQFFDLTHTLVGEAMGQKIAAALQPLLAVQKP